MYEINRTHYSNTYDLPGGPTALVEWVDRSPTIELHEDENGDISAAKYISYSISALLLVSLVSYMMFVG